MVERSRGALRGGAFTLAVITPLGIAIFALVGPLQHGWAAKAGTPASLLPHPASSSATTVATRTTALPSGTHELKQQFAANLKGKIVQVSEPNGAIVELRLRMTGQVKGQLRMRLGGQPLQGGGLSMTGSQVDLAADGTPSVYQGQVTTLAGTRIIAKVTDSSGSSLQLRADLQIDQQTAAVTGTLLGTPG
jgi:hypothetical protein